MGEQIEGRDVPVTTAFERGLEVFDAGNYEPAREHFQSAVDSDPENARARSYLGVCLAICERRFEDGLALCTSASKQEFFNPEVYLNLARVHLHFGFKAEGRRFLLRGQMIDPANGEIQQALDGLGRRVEPVLGFLPRRHFVNRWLGSAKHVFGRGRVAA
ncbi:MAG: tetratricopeptide repeat protein [Myxococcota bacterium]|jgi:Flp pilus assembly protein TadD|nr:tetratricopeptide repeat protein [Myxococcota bacterium]